MPCCASSRRALGDVSSAELRTGRHRARTARSPSTCATDGNHGRSVAWGAQLFGCRCVIYIHETVSQGRADAIARYGAEVRRVPGNYDDAVRQAARDAAANGWIVVSDTSYPGYIDIPRDVMQGYTVMADEALAQMAGAADACLHPGRRRRAGGGGVRPSLGDAGRAAAARGRGRARPRRLPVRIRGAGPRRQHPRRARHDDGRARLRRDVDPGLGDSGRGCIRLPDRHRRGGGGVHAPAGHGHRRRSARGRRRVRGGGARRAAVRRGAPRRWRRRWAWIQGRACCCSAARAIPIRRCTRRSSDGRLQPSARGDACRFAAGLAGSGRSIRGNRNMARIVTVGAAQLGPIAKDEPRRQVVERLVAHLHNAKKAGCDLVVFPELALTTFFPRWFSADQAWVDAWFERQMPGSETQALFDAAAKLQVGLLSRLRRADRRGRADAPLQHRHPGRQDRAHRRPVSQDPPAGPCRERAVARLPASREALFRRRQSRLPRLRRVRRPGGHADLQ